MTPRFQMKTYQFDLCLDGVEKMEELVEELHNLTREIEQQIPAIEGNRLSAFIKIDGEAVLEISTYPSSDSEDATQR